MKALLGIFGLIPGWVYAIAVAVLGFALYVVQLELQTEIAGRATDAANAAKRQAAALQSEIERHNAAVDALRKANEVANGKLEQAEREAKTARAMVDAGAADMRRLRDANATGILAAVAAVEAAGAARLCAPAVEAARVRAVLLERIDAVAGDLAERAQRLSAYADSSRIRHEACVRAYEVNE